MKENENKVMESFYHYIGENHVNHIAKEFDRISTDASEMSTQDACRNLYCYSNGWHICNNNEC